MLYELAVNIMIQGTMSNVGKSLIAAGLCRVFKQDGFRVAPFKSQNMALNSFITEEGLEMGRAQVVQAEACGIKPSVAMNPILLKPTTDVGSQVIVNGRPVGNMKASEYFRRKKNLIPDIMAAYSRLASENDIIVIEGAGSPAEINLKSDDIVNMGLAELVDAPVLLAGDIDRGGVFAQLAGTMLLLEEHERARVRGLIINKFRGDASILRPGLDMIEDICKKPVIGVVPYTDADIDDEDSLTERFLRRHAAQDATDKKSSAHAVVCVIRLPRISNFSDFTILEATPGVDLIYADTVYDLEGADIIIIPGSKSTISDLEWLKRKGFGNALIRAARNGTSIIGICGGYQMLGESIIDDNGSETDSPHTEAAGLGLLPVTTSFTNASEKETARTDAVICASDSDIYGRLGGIKVSGYEIHMGFSKITDSSGRSFAARDGGGAGAARCDGCVRGSVMGTYIHGIFDCREFTEGLLEGVKHTDFSVPDMAVYKEMQYDKLAAAVRGGLDMKAVYGIMGMHV